MPAQMSWSRRFILLRIPIHPAFSHPSRGEFTSIEVLLRYAATSGISHNRRWRSERTAPGSLRSPAVLAVVGSKGLNMLNRWPERILSGQPDRKYGAGEPAPPTSGHCRIFCAQEKSTNSRQRAGCWTCSRRPGRAVEERKGLRRSPCNHPPCKAQASQYATQL